MYPTTKCTILVLFTVILKYLFNFSAVTVLLASAIPALAFVFFGNGKSNYKLPPGPMGLPIIGCLPWLTTDSNKYMLDCHRKYGDMFTLKMGAVTNVIINDYDLIKEFGNLTQAQNRPRHGVLYKLVGNKGILDSNGETWRHQRRFLLQSLRDSGMGKLRMDDKITDEIEKMAKHIEKQNGRPILLREILSKVACSVICNLAFDKQFTYDDPEFLQLIGQMNRQMIHVGKLAIVSFFPWLEPFFGGRLRQALSIVDETKLVCRDVINEHKQNLNPDNPRDFIDLFLLEMKKDATEETKGYLGTFTEEQLIYTTMNLFFAGTETVANTILWALAYMLVYPDVQQKVQKEIDDVLGEDGTPSAADRYRLVYTSATLQECERLATLVPRALPRSNDVAINFRDYSFPPNTMFNFNVHAVHRNSLLWADANDFKPERFIQPDGTISRPQYLIPFGAGRRACPGEALAKTEIFLMFTTLLQKFHFETPDGSPFEIQSSVGLSNIIHDYEVIARPRHVKSNNSQQ